MRAYAAITSARLRTLLQYRAAAIAGFATQLFWGFIRVMIFEAFYRSSTAPQPMSFPQVVTYVWLGQAMLGLFPSAESDVRSMMRSGTVAYEMLRPLDLYSLWYSRTVATRVAPTLLRAVPLLLLTGLFFGLQAPPSWASAAGWVVTTLAAVLLACAVSMLLTISLLWTISGDGISRLAPSVIYVLSGMLVPLPLYPDWAQSLLKLLPFGGLIDLPFRVYVGHIPPEQLGAVLAHQVAWTLALVLLGRGLLALGTRRLVIQGG
jgi:ABC-2 type transport system permease protein